MAEAHSAVAFSFAISHEGVHINYDTEVLYIIWRSGLRSWARSVRSIINNARCGVFPASLSSAAFAVGAFNALYIARDFYGFGIDPSFGFVHTLKKFVFAHKEEHLKGVICATLFGFGAWLGVCILLKYSLKALFMYKGWIYEERGKGSKITMLSKIWVSAVRLLTHFSQPMLYSYQGSLPRLPVPSLDETLSRYLRSVRPLLNDDEYAAMKDLAGDFKNGIGKRCQRYLVLKSWVSTNYVSDWWEEFVYLRGRSPIMVNSNFYGTDSIMAHPTTNQAARAANISYLAFMFRRSIDNQKLKPIMVQHTVPLCSSQYSRTFNTVRIPGVVADKLVHYGDSTHIVAFHKGRYFKVPCYYKGRLLNCKDMQIQFERILDNDSLPEKGEEIVAALTAGDRVHWAETRAKYFSNGVNRLSLDAIEKAAFVVILEDKEYKYDKEESCNVDEYAHAMLHGKGTDRWFDKSFNMIVMKNGRVGFNAEHGWADAAVMSHLWECVLSEDLLSEGADAPILAHMWEFIMSSDLLDDRYDSNGNIKGDQSCNPPLPTKLKWNFSSDCLEAIDISHKVADALFKDVDLRILMFKHFGKGFIKNCRLSPDAFIQMALQLAYFRDAGKFNLTYEASMTRLFRDGRTETVRPCTMESVAFVHSVEDRTVAKDDKIAILQHACLQHQNGYRDAMVGKGIDRHLFCLYVVSKYLELNSPFLAKVLAEPWRLSTSQTPCGQSDKLDIQKYPQCTSAGGGFGPVADDGYGVSYIIPGEDIFFFHISSKKSSPETNSQRFAMHIEQALIDMQKLFTD